MFTIDGHASGTAYSLYGNPDNPCMILVHGLGLTGKSTWAEMIPTLAQKFYVISYDLLGHGKTDIPSPNSVNLTALSDQLRQLMDDLSIDKAIVVGFSLGGMINRRFALDYPERVLALAILNSPHERGAEQQKLVEKRAADTASGGPSANIDATLARWFTAKYRQNNPEKVANVKAVVLANDPVNYAAHRMVLAAGVKELIAPNPAITKPCLVLTCEFDSGSTPVMAMDIAAENPNGSVQIVPNLQHLGLIEQPQIFAEAILIFVEKEVIECK